MAGQYEMDNIHLQGRVSKLVLRIDGDTLLVDEGLDGSEVTVTYAHRRRFWVVLVISFLAAVAVELRLTSLLSIETDSLASGC